MIKNINKYIEHTVLSAFATEADVERVYNATFELFKEDTWRWH